GGLPVARLLPNSHRGGTGMARSGLTVSARSARGPSGDRLFHWLTTAVAIGVIGLLIAIAWQLVVGAMPTFRTFGLGFITGEVWEPGLSIYGALPFIARTIATFALAI